MLGQKTDSLYLCSQQALVEPISHTSRCTWPDWNVRPQRSMRRRCRVWQAMSSKLRSTASLASPFEFEKLVHPYGRQCRRLGVPSSAQVGRNSKPYFVAIALASSEPFCVGLPVSSMLASATMASKTPPGELIMIWRPTSGPVLTKP